MIEFSFKGSKEDLFLVLRSLAQGQSFLPTVGASVQSLAPQPVSAQVPPPAPPRLTPQAPSMVVEGAVSPSIGAVPATFPPQMAPPPVMEPLTMDPVYDGDATLPSNLQPSNPVPTQYPPQDPTVAVPGFDFAKLPLEPEAFAAFQAVMVAWVVNFDSPMDEKGEPTEEQPDRLELLKNLGSGRWPVFILRWCAKYGSLQGAIHAALPDLDLEQVDRVSANIIQVAHAAFPDIVGFHDHSTKWRRELAS